MATPQELTDIFSLANPDGNRNERTLADLKHKLRDGLSEKQIAYAISLATQLRNPEPKVPAPTGKGQVFTGTIVSAKLREGFRGALCIKITVRIDTPAGHWLAWGSLPKALHCTYPDGSARDAHDHTADDLAALKNRSVTIKATLKPSSGADSEPHFAFMERPTGAFTK